MHQIRSRLHAPHLLARPYASHGPRLPGRPRLLDRRGTRRAPCRLLMAPVSNLLHRTPWWALLGGGLVLFLGLTAFTTPFHLMRLEKSGRTPEENRAIK